MLRMILLSNSRARGSFGYLVAIVCIFLLAAFAPQANAAAINTCTNTAAGNFTDTACTFGEFNGDNVASEIGKVVTLGVTVTSGNVYIGDFGAPDLTNPSNQNFANVSDVLIFTTTTGQLVSKGCNSPFNPNSTSCFPAFGSAPQVFVYEDISGNFSYSPDIHHFYNGVSSPDTQTPEPATFGITACTLLLGGFGFRRMRKEATA